MRIAVIDNYDSFTYNLVHLVKSLGVEVDVFRNDQFRLSSLELYDKLLLSPGPGIPSEAGLLLEVIKTYAPPQIHFGHLPGPSSHRGGFWWAIGSSSSGIPWCCHSLRANAGRPSLRQFAPSFRGGQIPFMGGLPRGFSRLLASDSPK